jgi:hypothetical protein
MNWTRIEGNWEALSDKRERACERCWSEAFRRRCQSKILNTWSGHRTAQIDPEKCRKSNDREIRF